MTNPQYAVTVVKKKVTSKCFAKVKKVCEDGQDGEWDIKV